MDRGAAAQRHRITGEHAGDAAHVQLADRRVAVLKTFDQGLVPAVDAALAPGGAAPLVPPLAAHGRQAGHGVHVGRAVAAAGEAVADADEGAVGGAVQAGEGLDLLHREPGDCRCPLGAAGGEVRLELGRAVGVAGHEAAVRIAVAEGDVHGGAGQRRVRAGAQGQVHVGSGGARRAVGIDHHQLGAALLPGAGDVAHQVDLGGDGVAAPHHDQVGLRHLPRVRAPDVAHPRLPPGGGDGGADRHLLARVAHDVAQPLDAVALHQAHGAGGVIGPDGKRAVLRRRVAEGIGDPAERLVPANAGELAGALRPRAQQGMGETVRMVGPLGVAPNLRADDARGVAVVGPAHGADAGAVEHLDIQRTGGRTIVRADGGMDQGVEGHARTMLSRPRLRQAF